jgi:arylsulfatase A-like enzyme
VFYLLSIGGFPKFIQQGFNSNFLPVWLQDAGYNTYYTGKLFNAHTTDNYHSPFIAGFNGSDFLLDPHTYSYLHPAYQRNHDPPVKYNNTHTLDLVTEKAYGFLEDAIAADGPFFLGVAPVAPHSNIDRLTSDISSLEGLLSTPPIPLKKHEHLFEDVKLPRTENFNPDKVELYLSGGTCLRMFKNTTLTDLQPSGVNWVSRLPKLNQTVLDYNDSFYRSRLRALQAVDELVDGIVSRLEEHGILDTTYIIYTSDNGYHIGQHRLPPGKECGFEEDIRVPLFIRGPDVPADRVEDSVTTHIDLAPTVFNIAGIPVRSDFDGSSVSLTDTGSKSISHEHANVEFWGLAIPEGAYNDFGTSRASTWLLICRELT